MLNGVPGSYTKQKKVGTVSCTRRHSLTFYVILVDGPYVEFERLGGSSVELQDAQNVWHEFSRYEVKISELINVPRSNFERLG